MTGSCCLPREEVPVQTPVVVEGWGSTDYLSAVLPPPSPTFGSLPNDRLFLAGNRDVPAPPVLQRVPVIGLNPIQLLTSTGNPGTVHPPFAPATGLNPIQLLTRPGSLVSASVLVAPVSGWKPVQT